MIRMNKLTDYALLVLTHVAREADQPSHTARDLAARSKVPLPTVGKILKDLARAGILVSHRGVKGGYQLARPAESISVAQVVTALEGPIALTECGGDEAGVCILEHGCLMRANWRTINSAIKSALEQITLAALSRPIAADTFHLSPAARPLPPAAAPRSPTP